MYLWSCGTGYRWSALRESTHPPQALLIRSIWQLWVRNAEIGSVVPGPLDSHSGAIHLSTLGVSPDNGILASGFMKSLYGTSPAGRNMATPSRAALIFFALDFLLLVQVWDLGQGSILFSSMVTEASIGRAELVAHLDS